MNEFSYKGFLIKKLRREVWQIKGKYSSIIQYATTRKLPLITADSFAHYQIPTQF